MRYLKWVIIVVLTPLVLFGLFLVFAGITNYSPEEETVQSENKNVTLLSDTISFSLVSWNLGYAGLDRSMDFFYDGGTNVRPTQEASLKNLEGILKTLKTYHNYDMLLLQEIDVKSKRSYHIDQYNTLGRHFKGYSKNMGINYKVKFVPIPPSDPMGTVYSGLATFSKTEPAKSIRYSFPGNYSWPMGMFMLDRCFLVNEYPLVNGKNLIVINTHNSAYDDGSLRQMQMDFMKSILVDYYKQGNYVIVGGDWNQCPNGFKPGFDGDVFDTDMLAYIDPGYPASDWKWAYDSTIPTNRRVMIPYEKGKTPVTLIDFFLVSPNVEVKKVLGRDLGFEFSDHQPVEMEINLIPGDI